RRRGSAVSVRFSSQGTATSKISTRSLHDALPICQRSNGDAAEALDDADPHGDVVAVGDSVALSDPGEAVAGASVALPDTVARLRSEEHTSELQSREKLVCRLLLEKKNYGWTGSTI